MSALELLVSSWRTWTRLVQNWSWHDVVPSWWCAGWVCCVALTSAVLYEHKPLRKLFFSCLRWKNVSSNVSSLTDGLINDLNLKAKDQIKLRVYRRGRGGSRGRLSPRPNGGQPSVFFNAPAAARVNMQAAHWRHVWHSSTPSQYVGPPLPYFISEASSYPPSICPHSSLFVLLCHSESQLCLCHFHWTPSIPYFHPTEH